MENSLLIGLIVIIYSPLVLAEDKESKVKLIDAQVLNKDTNYYESAKLKVVKDTDTHSKLSVEWSYKKDFPTDIVLTVQVNEGDKIPGVEACRGFSPINTYYISICNNNMNRYTEYLSETMQKMKEAGECFKKGPYKNDDYGTFKFYNLLINPQWKDRCYKLSNEIKLEENVLYQEELQFISNE